MQKKTGKLTSRNKQWDLMRAIGIIFIVWGHNYQPPFLFFPAFYFHLSLFFFISGYFFKSQITIRDKLRYFFKKTRNQLLPYLILNLFFGLLTMSFKPIGINLGLDLNLYTMFIAPFGRGDQFVLYLAAWFLFNLYFISVFAGLIYQKNLKVNIGIVVISFIMMLIFLDIGNKPNNSLLMVFIIRSIFGFGFFSLGYLFHLLEPQIQKFIIKPVGIIFLYLIVDILSINFGNISYSIMFGTVNNSLVIIPVITSFCIILLVYVIAFYGIRVFKQNSFIYEIGQNSFSIMAWHLTFFFLINIVLYKLSLIPFSALSDVYFRYKVEKLWLVYQIPAIIAPVIMVRVYNLLKQKVLANIRLGLGS